MNVNYISQQGLRNLAGYAYHGEDLSILRRLFLNRFWNWLTTWYPLWLAPNLITFTSFLILTGNMLTMYYYCPGAVGCDLPPWTFLTFAIGVFLYQTLDNTDGKQAVRTKSSSALGELFDHGCDSLFPTFAGITIMAAAGIDSPWLIFAFLHVGMIPFVLAHWEEYHTGILILGPLANPTEAETVISIFHLLTWWNGTALWTRHMRDTFPVFAANMLKSANLSQLLDWRVNEFGGTVACIGVVPMVLWNIYTVGQTCTNSKKCSMLYACWPLLPFGLHAAFSTAWLWLSPTKLLETHTFLAVVWYGIIVSYLLVRSNLAAHKYLA